MRTPSACGVALVALALAGLASGSKLADLTGIEYQNDLDAGRDADDACTAFPTVGLPHNGDPDLAHALLVAVDDMEDWYRLERPASAAASVVRMDPASGLPNPLGLDYDLAAYVDCHILIGLSEQPFGNPETIVVRWDRLQGVERVGVQAYVWVPAALPAPGPGAENCDPLCSFLGYRLTAQN